MNDKFRKEAEENGLSFVGLILERISELRKTDGIGRTLFAACPNSMETIRVSLECAKRWDSPVKFPATLNQVDVDGGYTGLTQEELVRLIRQEARAINFTGPVIVAMDHGGPWLKDLHKRQGWSYEATMKAVKTSFERAIDAGYDLIHVDPTVDRTLQAGESINIDMVVERTVELMAHAEGYRISRGYPRIAYEVGTEEVHGGLADLNTFRRFLEQLKKGLNERNVDAWPVFVVGKVGTDLHTSTFDPDMAKTLTEIATGYGSLIKGHYTDNVLNPWDYPSSDMGAANVGPEFTEREYDALTEMAGVEEQLFAEGRIAKLSEIKRTLWNAVIASGRWKKWVQEGESELDFYANSKARQEWFVKTGCRYIWETHDVVAVRVRLYDNLENNGLKPENIVASHIGNSMDKYFREFNLSGLNQKIIRE